MKSILHNAENVERILQLTADTMILIDSNGTCVDIDTHSDLWFLQEESLFGKNIFDLLPEYTLQKLLPEFQKVISQQTKSVRNYQLSLRDETYYFKCIMSPYDNMVLCQYRDITERSNVKLQLERMNYELKEIQKAAQIGQWKYDAKEQMLYYSGHTGVMCLEEMQQIPLDTYLNVIFEEDKERFHIWLKKMLDNTNKDEIDYRICLQNEIYYMRLQAYFHEKNEKGEQIIEGYIQNVTDIQRQRQRYESQIKRLNRIMDTTMENIPAGIVVKDIDNDYRYVYRNRESYNRDISGKNAIGMNDFDYYPAEIAQQKRSEDVKIASTGKGMHWILEGKDKNGNLLILDKQKIMVESEYFSPIIVSIEWDITQLELIRRELITSKEKAETSDKLKSAFLANMSHEIRTPLNAIVGFSRLIAESDNAEERKEYSEIVDSNNERLLQLINEILDLSKIESGIVEFTYGPVQLHHLCKEIYDAHVFRCPMGVHLAFEPSDEKLSIHSDQNRIFQVFSNLIGNAFKFTTSGNVSYGYKQEGSKVILHVTDTGMGIEPEKVSRVFERFAKLNNIAQGTGLGLSICQTIIERLGGEISVTSEVGKGTTFTFTLPYEILQEKEITQDICETTENMGSNLVRQATTLKENREITILIAEDTDSNFDLLNAILGKTYKLIRARDGMEAVTLFDEVAPDLILMDIKMPNLDGLEATKIIRELSAHVPIIAQSAYAYEHDRKAAQEAGCNDFLSKPISQTKLKETLKKWLAN